mmetsp:Transcript_13272/g.52973  ORF Transcript_13272/g.52973 Transcript_13272/m.52973 type:complete len:83 (-) Transcript_13272:1241-1489(-)
MTRYSSQVREREGEWNGEAAMSNVSVSTLSHSTECDSGNRRPNFLAETEQEQMRIDSRSRPPQLVNRRASFDGRLFAGRGAR